MGYYRGDGANYYRGDYYRGDPFLAALAGAAVKGIAGGAVGRAIGRAGKWVGSRVGRAAGAAGPILREAAPSAVAGGVGVMLGQRGQLPSLPGLGPIGPDMTPIGPDGRRVKGGKYVWTTGRRRMNPLNPKALRRALRRAEGFEKFAKRTVNAMYRVIDGRKVRTFKKRKSS